MMQLIRMLEKKKDGVSCSWENIDWARCKTTKPLNGPLTPRIDWPVKSPIIHIRFYIKTFFKTNSHFNTSTIRSYNL
jgi:hypothetical protein